MRRFAQRKNFEIRTTTEAHLDARHQLARSQKPLFIGESGAPGGTRTPDLLVRSGILASFPQIYPNSQTYTCLLFSITYTHHGFHGATFRLLNIYEPGSPTVAP